MIKLAIVDKYPVICDALEALVSDAADLETVILEKGNPDIISDGERVVANRTGNPFMTVGGTGDTLAGICGAYLAFGLDPFTAACAGAFVNGRAGDLAAEELGHKKKLERIRQGQTILIDTGKIADLKIADYTVDTPPDPDMDFQHALLLAMKKEKKAFRLYTRLAEDTEDPDLSALFRAIAREEAGHKLRFETLYDDRILTEN